MLLFHPNRNLWSFPVAKVSLVSQEGLRLLDSLIPTVANECDLVEITKVPNSTHIVYGHAPHCVRPCPSFEG